MAKPLALDLTQSNWEVWLKEKKQPPYIAKQIRQWLFHDNVTDPSLFTNVSKKIRALLEEEFRWKPFKIDTLLQSEDGSEKFLLITEDGLMTEMVLMPSDNRITLCISSQVGCRMGCTFCQTGKLGFKRNLSSGEILGQIILANQRLNELNIENRVRNIVFMGMGEPLDNFDAVVEACKTMIDPKAFGLSKHRVTVSTSGLVPEIKRLGEEVPVRLAISLHSPDDERRSSLMPVNRKYPLEVLKKTLLEYPYNPRYGITFEYVMIQGENDSLWHAKKLVKFIHGLKAKVNLIPMNHFPGNPMTSSEENQIRQFQKYLTDRSIPAPVRYSRGQDISGACGQLAAKREDELKKDPRILRKERSKQERLTSSWV